MRKKTHLKTQQRNLRRKTNKLGYSKFTSNNWMIRNLWIWMLQVRIHSLTGQNILQSIRVVLKAQKTLLIPEVPKA